MPRAELRLQLGARNSIQDSHVGVRNPITWAIPAASQGLHWQEAGVRSQSCISNPDTPTWDIGAPNWWLSPRPKAGSRQRVFDGSSSCGYCLSNMNQNSRLPGKRRVFSINHIVCSHNVGTLNPPLSTRKQELSWNLRSQILAKGQPYRQTFHSPLTLLCLIFHTWKKKKTTLFICAWSGLALGMLFCHGYIHIALFQLSYHSFNNKNYRIFKFNIHVSG